MLKQFRMNSSSIFLTALVLIVMFSLFDVTKALVRPGQGSELKAIRKRSNGFKIEITITITIRKRSAEPEMFKLDDDKEDIGRMRQELSDSDVITMTKLRLFVQKLRDEGYTVEQITEFLQRNMKINVADDNQNQ